MDKLSSVSFTIFCIQYPESRKQFYISQITDTPLSLSRDSNAESQVSKQSVDSVHFHVVQ